MLARSSLTQPSLPNLPQSVPAKLSPLDHHWASPSNAQPGFANCNVQKTKTLEITNISATCKDGLFGLHLRGFIVADCHLVVKTNFTRREMPKNYEKKRTSHQFYTMIVLVFLKIMSGFRHYNWYKTYCCMWTGVNFSQKWPEKQRKCHWTSLKKSRGLHAL